MLTPPPTLLETVFMRPFDLGKRGIKYIYNFPIICSDISFPSVNSKHLVWHSLTGVNLKSMRYLQDTIIQYINKTSFSIQWKVRKILPEFM